MKFLRHTSLFVLMIVMVSAWSPASPDARTIRFDDGWAEPGYSVTYSGADSIELVFSVPSVSLVPETVNGKNFVKVSMPGAMLPTTAGAPNLPGSGRFVAVPNGAKVHLEILSSRTRTLEGIDVVPSARLPFDVEKEAPVPVKDMSIYGLDQVWPAQPVQLSEPMQVRGVDSRVLGITPFAYNPVSRRLTIFTDIRVRLVFEGGDGSFGDDRLRSRYWDPILERQLVNFDALPVADYASREYSGRDGVEYIIIVPDNPDFITWGQTLADFRILQGISSQVYTVTEIGGNTVAAIEGFIDNAYANWATAPVAFLLLGDYADSGAAGGITSPSYPHPYSGTYITDNAYADIDGDGLPELVSARITARNAAELSTMINKVLTYEQTPPTAAGFYDNPLVACGFQTERWFQVCTEIVQGFWANELGKSPVRQYNVYSGSPAAGGSWSSNANTYMLIDYFGDSGLQYFPDTIPAGIDWYGGSAAGVNAAVNAGAFILQHRDHGAEDGWSEPNYTTTDLPGLSNGELLPWVFSINCLTGRFDYATEVFAEAFHRMDGGALGLTAATQVSYSFVNDTFIFGVYDSLWPDFDPGYPSAGRATGSEDLRPGFSNVNGKYYLEASNWPYNPGDKDITYGLFHTHSDAFVTLFSEVPSTMSVSHPGVLFAMTPIFQVTAPVGSVIALTRGGEIIGVADGTGAPVNVSIAGQQPGLPPVTVTVTKANSYRYETSVEVVPQEGPYVSYENHTLDDDNSGFSSGNGDGIATPGEIIELEMGLKNYGVDTAYGVTATVTSPSPHVQINDGTASYGDFLPDESKNNPDTLVFQVLGSCPHLETIQFDVEVTDGVDIWDSAFFITVEAAQMALYGYALTDLPNGNGDGNVDMGEWIYLEMTVENVGSVTTTNVSATLSSIHPDVVILDGAADFPDIGAGGTASSLDPHFRFQVDLNAACGTILPFTVNMATDQGSSTGSLSIVVGGRNASFYDDMESGEGDWTHTAALGVDDWSLITVLDAPSPTHVWYCSETYGEKDDYLISPTMTLNALSELSFWHMYEMESNWDGCVLEISVEGGAWTDLGDDIIQGGYNNTLYSSSNPLGGRNVWSGTLPWSQVVVDLSAHPEGTEVQFRFRLGCDSSVNYDGWYIDSVEVTGADCQPWSGGGDTLSVSLSCAPSSGTLPFNGQFEVQLTNLTAESRRAAAIIAASLANGQSISNWKSGWTNLDAGESYVTNWNQSFPALGSLLGDNVFTLVGEDVTPPPYNQPPYAASGDTGSDVCTVTAVQP